MLDLLSKHPLIAFMLILAFIIVLSFLGYAVYMIWLGTNETDNYDRYFEEL